MSPYRDDDNYGRKYTGFEEGYTSADNRAPRRRPEGGERRPGSGERKPGGSARSRFIDTGDRYMSSYTLPDEAEKMQQPEPEVQPEPQPVQRTEPQPVQPSPFPERNDDLPYDEIYAPGHSRSMSGDYSIDRDDEAEEQPPAHDAGKQAARGRENRPPRPQRETREAQQDESPVRSEPSGNGGFVRIVDGVKRWLDRLDERTIGYIFGGTILAVAMMLGASIIMRTSCSSCGRPAEIPVIEQGDGLEGLDNVQDYGQETESGSDTYYVIDEEIPTDTFEVIVTDADGRYRRTNVYRAEEATLDIAEQDQLGFTFSLEACAEGTSGTVAGQAYFCGESEAIFEGSTGTLNFRFGSGGVTVYMTDTFEAFNGAAPDGIYVSGEPTYIEDAAAQSEESGLDAQVRESEAVQAALQAILPEQDMSLMNSIINNGTARVFENSEKGYDKNGTPINIDGQLNAVKYFSFVSGSGEELVLICTNDGMVYLGICDGAEYRYYTNDPAYTSDAPRAIAGQAAGKGMSLIYK